jgi:ABC-2 type transport system ATP-binding protein
MSEPEKRPIVMEGVHRRFGDHAVLRGLNLSVRPGEIHALLGRNGSGKSTALRILLGFLAPHAGRSSLLGTDSQQLGPEQRGRIGYVHEDHRLLPWMRVSDVMAFEAGTRPGFDAALAREAAVRCGLRERSRVITLSRGQRAQLALIVAVAARPEVLICDDPALGLDAIMRRALLEVMIELLAERGSTVLFSTHIFADVERVADRVSILHEGRLIVDVRLDDLKRRVQRRYWSAPGAKAPPAIKGLLRSSRRRGGFDLTLLDLDGDDEAALRAGGASLSPAAVPSLEDLFLDLTAGETPSILPARKQEADAA